jgi:hypothetical protein
MRGGGAHPMLHLKINPEDDGGPAVGDPGVRGRVSALLHPRAPADRLSRIKARVKGVFADLVGAATPRGRRPTAPRNDRTLLLGALLAVATRLLALSAVPVRRRAVQDELVSFGCRVG